MKETQLKTLVQSVKLIAAAVGADLKPDADLKTQSMHGTACLLGRMVTSPEGACMLGRAAAQYVKRQGEA